MNNTSLLARSANWNRSADDKIIFGVASGIARKLNLDPWLVRLIWILACLVLGTGIVFYLVAALCLPLDTDLDGGHRKRMLGVCERLSQRLDVDVGLVRMATVGLAFATLGCTILAYVVLYLFLEQDSHSGINLTDSKL